MKVLVSGDRHWPWERHGIIKEALSWFDPKETILVHGAAEGADKISQTVAVKLLGWPVENIRAYPANWTVFGKPAGRIRNKQMLDTEHPDLVLAFHPDLLNQSKGTYHMVKYACENGVPVLHYV